MKKLAIAAAVAASVSAGAQATTYNISSDVTGFAMFLGTNNVFNAPLTTEPGNGYVSGVEFGGQVIDADDDGQIDAGGNVTFSGVAVFNAGPDVRLTFSLSGAYQTGASEGVLMNSGTVLIETNTGSGYTVYNTVDASVDNIAFLSSSNAGHLGQPTAGLTLDPIAPMAGGTVALPGLWDGMLFGGKGLIGAGVSSVTLFGNSAGIYMEGDVLLAPVPIPAAAWLFGSALIGLASIGRKRST